jgi:hypothetical protein
VGAPAERRAQVAECARSAERRVRTLGRLQSAHARQIAERARSAKCRVQSAPAMRLEFSGPPSHERLAFSIRAPETRPGVLQARRDKHGARAARWALRADFKFGVRRVGILCCGPPSSGHGVANCAGTLNSCTDCGTAVPQSVGCGTAVSIDSGIRYDVINGVNRKWHRAEQLCRAANVECCSQ